MPAGASPVSFQPSFSLAALLLVLAGLAIIGNTIVGGLPDKILALAKTSSSGKSSPATSGPTTLVPPTYTNPATGGPVYPGTPPGVIA